MNSSGQTATQRVKSNQNIQVYVRVRPTNAREKLIKSLEMVEVHTTKEIMVKHALDGKMSKKFTFDKVFGQESRQSDVYSSVVGPLIEEVLAGYNCTVFAYGQTGTGKTYTMIGEEEPVIRSSWDDDSMIGIIPRALNHLFDELRLMELEYSMRISYLELYNEELCDLLSSTDDSTKIRIFDDSTKKGSLIIQGLEEIPVHNINDVYKLLAKGQEKRKTAATLMNAQSSRSHTVFSILVHIRENGIDGEEMVKIGKLNLVDLAGSENISKAGNEKGIRTRETVNINQSLLTLGRVITALVERAPHIPYRESKLTRLLQESLGGRTKTSIIATISPGHKDIEETLSTLEYAHRAKNIQNKPEINQRLNKRTILKEFTEEIDRLKRDLMAARDKNGIFLAEDTYNDMVYKLEIQNKEINDKLILIKALKEDLTSKQKLFSEVSLTLIDKTEQLNEKEKILCLTKTELDHTQKNLSHAKRRCEEKTYLLDKHIKTEEVLTKQAIDLITVAEHASSDTYSLHNTITRRKEVDNKLKSSCDQFSIKLTNTLNDMNINLNNLKTNYIYQSNIILSDIDSNSKSNKQLKKAFGTQLKTLVSFNNDSINNMYNCIEDYTKLTNNWSAEYKHVIDELLENVQKRVNNIIREFNEQIVTIQETYTAQNTNFDKLYQEIVKEGYENTSMIEKFCVNQGINLRTITAEVTNVLNKNLTIINQTLSKNMIANKDHLENINSMEIEVQKLFNTMRKQVEASNANTEIITNATINLNNNNVKLNENIENHVITINNNNNAVQNNLTSINTLINDLYRENSENVAANTDKINVMHEHQNSTITSLQSDVVSVKTKIDEELCHMNENTISVKNDALSIQQNTLTHIDVEYKQFSTNIENEINKINEQNTQTIAFQTLLRDSIDKYESDCRSTIDLSKNHLEKFVSEEMVVYVPTGETPMKKQFNFTKNLVSTSPHESLIKRFRLDRNLVENNSMNSVTEDEESTLSVDENFVNSTPMKASDGNEVKMFKENKRIDKILNIPTLGNLENIPDNSNISSLLDTKSASLCVLNDDTENQNNFENTNVR